MVEVREVKIRDTFSCKVSLISFVIGDLSEYSLFNHIQLFEGDTVRYILILHY